MFKCSSPKVFCFPFAGGSANAFRPLQENQLLRGFEVHCIELPGRGRRFGEGLLRNMDEMVDDVLDQHGDEFCGEFAFLGHSMGAMLAYRVALRLASENRGLPRVIFVSGSKGSVDSNARRWHLLAPPDFRQLLQDLGGCPPGLLDDTELYEIFEPILRADFEANSTVLDYTLQPLEVPIVALLGKEDPMVNPSDCVWEQATTYPLDEYQFPGGHFFLFNHWDSVCQLVVDRM